MTQSPDPPVKILFVCVGNACRSQMAEAWAKHFGNGRVQAFSAGSHPFGSITQDTYAVMSEKDVSLDGQCSKGLGDVAVADMDVVVVMGSEVECAVPTGFKGCKEDWEIPDPYGRSTSSYRNVRDMIELKVLELFAKHVARDDCP